MLKSANTRKREELTSELIERLCHNQHSINAILPTINVILKTRYQPEFSQVPEITARLIRFGNQYNFEESADPDKEKQLTCPANLLNMDLLREEAAMPAVTLNMDDDILPDPHYIGDKFNRKYRNLVPDELKDTNHPRDYLVKNK